MGATYCIFLWTKFWFLYENFRIFNINEKRNQLEMRSSNIYFNVIREVRDLFTWFKRYCTALTWFWENGSWFWFYRNFIRMLNVEVNFMGRDIRDDHRFNNFRWSILAVYKIDFLWLNWTVFLNNFSNTSDNLNIFVDEKFNLFFDYGHIGFHLPESTVNCSFSCFLSWRLSIENTQSDCILWLEGNLKLAYIIRCNFKCRIGLFALKELSIDGDTVDFKYFPWTIFDWNTVNNFKLVFGSFETHFYFSR